MRTIPEIDRETRAVRSVLELINDTMDVLRNKQGDTLQMLEDLSEEKNDTLRAMLDATQSDAGQREKS